jgi:hypothetical protein
MRPGLLTFLFLLLVGCRGIVDRGPEGGILHLVALP